MQVLPHRGLDVWELHCPGLEAGPLLTPLCFRRGGGGRSPLGLGLALEVGTLDRYEFAVIIANVFWTPPPHVGLPLVTLGLQSTSPYLSPPPPPHVGPPPVTLGLQS